MSKSRALTPKKKARLLAAGLLLIVLLIVTVAGIASGQTVMLLLFCGGIALVIWALYGVAHALIYIIDNWGNDEDS